MKNILKSLIILVSLSGCVSQPVNINQSVAYKSTSNKPITFSFKIKDAQSLSRIKSYDVYLVKNNISPLVPASNAYISGYKYQSDVTNGVINATFNNYQPNTPYYAAIQVYDDVKGSVTKNNITAINSSVTSGDNKVAISSNSVSLTNGSLVYSDSATNLNVLINLKHFNDLPVNLTPQSGSNTPTNTITAG